MSAPRGTPASRALVAGAIITDALVVGACAPGLRLPPAPAAHLAAARTVPPGDVAPPDTGRAPDVSGHPRTIQPERPSVATHAGTVAPGYAELETGAERDRADDGSHAVQVPTVLKLGIVRRVQLSLALPAQAATGTPFGLGDVMIGAKWRILEDRPLVQDVAVLPALKLATGGARGTGTTDASLLLINSRTVGPASLDLNVGATWRSGDGTRAPRTATLWTAAAGLPVRGPLGWALECYGYPGTAGPAGSPPIVAVLTGPTLGLRPEFAVDAGVIVPLTGPQPRALYAGLVTSLGRLPDAVGRRH